jgi:hypothetical protein
VLLRLGRGRWFVRRLFDGMGDGLDEQRAFFSHFIIVAWLAGEGNGWSSISSDKLFSFSFVKGLPFWVLGLE